MHDCQDSAVETTMSLTRREVMSRASMGVAATTLTALGGCIGSAGDDRRIVSVGSKRFTENELLGELLVAALESDEIEPTRAQWRVPDTQAVMAPLFDGELDVYWEYTGTLYSTHVAPDLPGDTHSKIAEAAAKSNEELYADVTAALESEPAVGLSPAPVDNTYRFVAREAWVAETGVETLSDLAAAINDEVGFSFAATREFTTRTDTLGNFFERYDVDTEAAGAIEAVAVEAFDERYEPIERGEADVCIGYETDPQPETLELRTLTDELDIFPAYAPLPLVSESLLSDRPELRDSLDTLGETIESTEEMRALVGRVVDGNESAEGVAAAHLEASGWEP